MSLPEIIRTSERNRAVLICATLSALVATHKDIIVRIGTSDATGKVIMIIVY